MTNQGATGRKAHFSRCGRYRYALERTFSGAGGDSSVLLVMLNPSTADAEQDDPTIRRCQGFARRLGAERLLVGNLYAWRATRPKDLFAATDPVGPANDRWLRSLARRADRIIVAWGAHAPVARSEAVSRLLARCGKPLLALGSTAAGQPRHPLYLRSDSPLFEWVVPKPRKVLRTKVWTLPSH